MSIVFLNIIDRFLDICGFFYIVQGAVLMSRGYGIRRSFFWKRDLPKS